MLILFGVLSTLSAAIVLGKLREGHANPPALGWMSERWLAEHRASHPS